MKELSTYIKLTLVAGCALFCFNGHSADFSGTSDMPPSHMDWDVLLKRHVRSNGLVDYKGFIKDKKALEDYLQLLSNNAPDRSLWSEEEQLAYWINAYNAYTVKLIVDNYPLKSIKDLNPVLSIPTVRSIWSKKFFEIGGKATSLDDIEHGILRKEFEEPRIHFAVNCASFSCPVLRPEAYFPEKINEQLEEQTVLFLEDQQRNKITKNNPKVSKIFSWFTKDFKRNGTVIDFLNQYLKDVQIDRGVGLKYLDYDWRLNEAE